MRSQKLDAIRGLALVGMIAFHTNFILLHIFSSKVLDFSENFWFFLGRSVAILFILVAGISSFLSTRNRVISQILRQSMLRFILLASLAGMISFVTYEYFYEQRISWGIIHFFALSTLCSLVFMRSGKWNILLGIVFLCVGEYLALFSLSSPWLIPAGLTPGNYFSADYYPLFPWFGYFLIGHGIAYSLEKMGFLNIYLNGKIPGGSFLAFFGRHSLIIYMIHVPIIYLALRIVFV